MLKVVVAEHNSTQRGFLKRVASENNLELEFVAIYINGLPALEYLLTGQADIFITNVDAPTVDGITIVKKLKEENIDVKTIFLSDSADFKTVKEAAVLNPVAYILKPAEDEEIKNALIKAIELCNKERTQREEHEELMKKAEHSAEALKSQFIRDMLYQSKRSGEYIDENCKSFSFDIKNKKKKIATFKIIGMEDGEITYSMLCAAAIFINDLSDEENYLYPIVMSDNELVVLVSSDNEKSLNEEIINLKSTIENRYEIKTESGVSEAESNITLLSTLYNRAKQAQLEILPENKERLAFYDELHDLLKMSKSAHKKTGIIAKRIKYIIAEEYSGKITTEEIAEKINYSKKQAQRIFLKETGKTIYEYLTEFRMEKAKEMLLEENAKIYSVAEKTGYKNVAHFKELFKKHTGQTPAEYKKQQKRNKE